MSTGALQGQISYAASVVTAMHLKKLERIYYMQWNRHC